ncbi:hypothetical protein [Noviherbaspirillum soli]|uniref:hypothetical protein n=1 Tax=Noviherbaspirillum soli TaxID=1064518 RepID=UPI00188A623E|nr:hypothetical protein [Noviherbaspirillum soli]
MRKFKTLAILGLAVIPFSLLPLTASASPDSLPSPSESNRPFFSVRADQFFNATGILAAPGESFLIRAKPHDVVDLSTLNGGYKTFADGTIVVTPPPDSGAFQYFRDRAGPIYSDPVAGSRKSLLPLGEQLRGHLPGAPNGALVAGFSASAYPTSFSDFPYGFVLINDKGIARAPSTGEYRYLFLAVNDINNPLGDNAGEFRVRIYRLGEGMGDAVMKEGNTSRADNLHQ